jgi:hypothetical protein
MSESVELRTGSSTWTVIVPAAKRVAVTRGNAPDPTAGPRELIRAALEAPIGLDVPLRRALVPDDHVVIVVDESVPHVGELVSEVIAHLTSGEVQPSAVTLLVPPPSGNQEWVEDLPDEFGDVHVEVHDPAEVKKVAYLTTTKVGRRVYLNRTLVEAEFVVVLSGRRFDPVCGYSGAEYSLFPELSNAETRAEFEHKPPPSEALRNEAATVAWHLGTPVFVQVIEGPGDSVAEVVAGLPGSSAVGVERQNARWKGTVGGPADLVIVTATGGRVGANELRHAVGLGLNCLRADGRFVLLTDAPAEAAADLEKAWADSDLGPHVYVTAGWDDDVIENLNATRLSSANELQRLIAAADRVTVLPDAHKSLISVG